MGGNRNGASTPHTWVTLAPPLTLGVVADTHIPDRAPRLPRGVLEVFDRAGVAAILHAGDLSSWQVLEELRRVAPVYAVRGNRDLTLWHRLPPVWAFRIGPWRVALVHGHHSFWRYVWDKTRFLLGHHLTFRFIERRALARVPWAHVVVLGHTHAPVVYRRRGQWVFNPGSPTTPPLGWGPGPRTVGLMHVGASGDLSFEFVLLEAG